MQAILSLPAGRMYNAAMSEAHEPDLWDHIEALRGNLLKALIGLAVGITISFFFTEPLINFLSQPVGGIENLSAIEVTESVSVYMRVALLCGVIVSLPWVLYQLFDFIGKGLTDKEKKGIWTAIPFATLLFLAGVAFAYTLMLPASLRFFTDFLQVQTSLRIKSYFSFLTNLLFWIGVSFQLPLIAFVLARVGVITAQMLLRGWRMAIVAIAVLSAVITPTGDPVNMAIFMVPLFGLYLLSIGLAFLAQRKESEAKPEEN